MRQIAAARPDWLETPELRYRLLLELFRQLSLLDFQTMLGSPGWRTYIALHATFMSLADGALRDQVQSALAQSEQAHNAGFAQAWRQLTALFGYRLRPGSGITFETLATLLSATMRGLVVMALSSPEVAEQRIEASPFGASAQGEWVGAAGAGPGRPRVGVPRAGPRGGVGRRADRRRPAGPGRPGPPGRLSTVVLG